jgi:hypothetical protein
MRVILDTLNPHQIASLSEAFPPAEARRITRTLTWQYPLKYGRWLHMPENERSGLHQHRLDRRMPMADTRTCEIAAREQQRTVEIAPINGRFSVADTCQKFARVYPPPLPLLP